MGQAIAKLSTHKNGTSWVIVSHVAHPKTLLLPLWAIMVIGRHRLILAGPWCTLDNAIAYI